jgi:hypothetical protein
MTCEIQSGSLLLYRVFDVGEEILLHDVEEILKAGRGEKRVRLSPSKPEALIVKDAPIRVQLGPDEVHLDGTNFPCEVTATIWNYASRPSGAANSPRRSRRRSSGREFPSRSRTIRSTSSRSSKA